MSDYFVNTLNTMDVGESVSYYAASKQSKENVESLVKSIDKKDFAVNITKQGVRFKLVIVRSV